MFCAVSVSLLPTLLLRRSCCQSCTDADDADIANDGARVLLFCTSSFVIAAVRRFFGSLLFTGFYCCC